MKGEKTLRGFASALVVIIGISLCSCAPTYLTRYSEATYFADYRPYTEAGFTISPTSSGFTYESIGEIQMIFSPGYKDAQTQDSTTSTVSTTGSHTNLYMPDVEEMMNKIVRQAQELGANALLNFKIEARAVTISATNGIATTTVPSVEYTLSGFAVKLKD